MALSGSRPTPDPGARRPPPAARWRAPVASAPRSGARRAVAYERITSELLLDGNARLNLATFVTTWMPSLGRG